MDSFKLHEILHSKVQPGPELNNPIKPNVDPDFNIPHIPKIEVDMESLNKSSDQNFSPNTPKNASKAFPLEIIVLLGLGLFCTYKFLQIPPNENYRRRRR